MLILATAGHVDHGKSALVATLTGSHPDRLVEEQLREMTIDIGFAFFNLPNGKEVGIIDVPGHLDFIDNMLAGMGGIDAVMLIIAADEGLMPQTKEHIGIIDLLEINQGIVVLTKVDLVEDPDWLNLIELDIQKELLGKSIEHSPIIRVSSKTNFGIPELVQKIAHLEKRTLKNDDAPRLPIDRVFTLQGFGTIVTGTLLDGSLYLGNEVEILPGNKKTRIRGIQTHNKKLESAASGNRTAVNLINIEKDLINRGDVLVRPNTYKETSRLDVYVRILPGEEMEIRHNDIVKFFAGTAKRTARIRLINANSVRGGELGFIQVELDKPICIKTGDHFILRKFSPSITIGGGRILDPHPIGRYKLMDAEKYRNLQLKLKGSIDDRLISELNNLSTLEILARRINESESTIKSTLANLLQKNEIIEIKNQTETLSRFISFNSFQYLKKELVDRIEQLHTEYPARKNFAIEEIRKSMRLDETDTGLLLDELVKTDVLVRDGKSFAIKGNTVKLSPSQEKKVSELWALIEKDPYSPPIFEECLNILGKELLKSLLENEQLIRVSREIVFREREYTAMVHHIDSLLNGNKPVTITDLRDTFDSSRKYIVPFLEHMDRIKKTRRVGDQRVKY